MSWFTALPGSSGETKEGQVSKVGQFLEVPVTA